MTREQILVGIVCVIVAIILDIYFIRSWHAGYFSPAHGFSVFKQIAERLRQSISSSTPNLTTSAQPIYPWALPSEQARFFGLALLSAVIILFLRLVKLDSLQNELYGDIISAYQYVYRILAGDWPTYFDLSAGPLYYYSITPIVLLTGPTYLGFKLASVLISLGVLVAIYAFSRRLVDDYFALLATFIAGVSSWLLIFSRLGNLQILVPLLTLLVLWFVIRIVQEGQRADVFACAVISALGLYLYPATFILPGVAALTLVSLRCVGHQVRWKDLGLFGCIVILCDLPFVWIVNQNQSVFAYYIVSKLETNGNLFAIVFENFVKTVLALHVRGDITSRSNPSGLPHLDTISGIFFLIGLIFWLLPKRRRWGLIMLVPFVLLQLPSLLVFNPPSEVPSAARTLGIAPISYILVASGIWWPLQVIRKGQFPWMSRMIGSVVLLVIMIVNVQRYFQAYISALPYHNTPISRLIADYVDSLPPYTQIYLIGCCWQDRMPDPRSVQYVVIRPENFTYFAEPNKVACDDLLYFKRPAVLIWSFQDELPAPQLAPCKSWLLPQLYTSSQGYPVFNAAPLRPHVDAGAGGAE